MKRILSLITCFLVLGSRIIVAHDTIQMFEDNPEWSYYVVMNTFNDNEECIGPYVHFYHLYIDGKESINGKEYYLLWCEYNDMQPLWLERIASSPLLCAHVRQDGSKILAPISDFSNAQTYMGRALDDEYIIYDWEWGEKEVFSDIMSVTRDPSPVELLDGTQRTSWHYTYSPEQTIIEGIGAIDDPGMLTHWALSFSVNLSTYIGCCLNTFVKNGHVLYTAPSIAEGIEQNPYDCKHYRQDPIFGEQVNISNIYLMSIGNKAPTYNLTGQELNNSFVRHGIYIKDRKKVLR